MTSYPNVYDIGEQLTYIHCFSVKGIETGIITIDTSDLELVQSYPWHIESAKAGIKYAAASVAGHTVRLHRLLMPNATIVDHINHNGLDNRRINLRSCSNAENSRNKILHTQPKSGYVGIRHNPKCNTYYVRIMVNKKEISLGHYDNIQDAIKARIEGEQKYFKKFRYNKNA